MTGMHYVAPRDFTRLEILEPFDVLLFGKGTPLDQIERLQDIFPDKRIGTYFMTMWELSPEEMRTYPGPMSDRVTGVGRVVGELSDATVEWHATRAKACVGTASILMADNADPRQLPGYTRSEWDSAAGTKRRENFWEYAPKTMAAVKEAIGDALLVGNVGHSLNPLSVSNPALRECYARYCASVNGIGIEKKTGSTVAFYTPSSFNGPYLSPRCSFAFAQDAAAWAATDAMWLPPNVVKSCVGWVVKSGAMV